MTYASVWSLAAMDENVVGIGNDVLFAEINPTTSHFICEFSKFIQLIAANCVKQRIMMLFFGCFIADDVTTRLGTSQIVFTLT